MKTNIHKILFLILLIILIQSCSDSPTEPGEPQFSFLIGNYDILLDFKERFFSIYSIYEIRNASLKLNDVNIGLNWIKDDYSDEWYCSIDTDTMTSYLKYKPGMELVFELKLNEHLFFDKIYLSDKQEIIWPDFNFNADYSFTWELEDIPRQQTIVMFLSDNSNHLTKYWHLDGSKREFTIYRDYYKNYNEDELDFSLILECYNKTSQSRHIAITNIFIFY